MSRKFLPSHELSRSDLFASPGLWAPSLSLWVFLGLAEQRSSAEVQMQSGKPGWQFMSKHIFISLVQPSPPRTVSPVCLLWTQGCWIARLGRDLMRAGTVGWIQATELA